MIIYQKEKHQFHDDVTMNIIDEILQKSLQKQLNLRVAEAERRSWRNSLGYMNNVLSDPEIPSDCMVAIEYKIPQTSNRVDVILTGQNNDNRDYAMIIELKQWETAELTDQDAVIRTFIGNGKRELTHPSYQAWSYASLLNSFNEAVYTGDIRIQPCAYLHNYTRDGIIDHPFYGDHIEKAPIFLRQDVIKLREFIKQFIRKGDRNRIMYRIESGRIIPSKSLADSLSAMMKGNPEFVLIDDQKLVYERALKLASTANATDKKVLIVEGGPGTGKTVVAINLLVQSTAMKLVSHYVTKNSAPRIVYEAKLTGSMKKSSISNLFKGSGSYTEAEENSFDLLIVDEAHRLMLKSGLYGNLGENQVKELVDASKCTVFFIDEDQRVTLSDIGTKSEIEKWAHRSGAEVQTMTLSSQFRCNGSDGFLAWIDNTLQIRQTANIELNTNEYDFRVFDDPTALFHAISEKNQNNKARVVAGYCWDWKSKRNPAAYDIEFPAFGFHKKWNLTKDGGRWLIEKESIAEIGCIHTCQGLELEYVGVIIGPDLVVRNGEVITDATKRSGMDRSVKGMKKMLSSPNKAETLENLDRIVKNTYRTLMTRGMKGCYVYCTDAETIHFLKSRIGSYGTTNTEFLTMAAEP
jgi:hypothetical protein